MSIAPVPPLASRFKPGQSGNPSGLPKNFRRVTDALRQLTETTGKSPEAIIEAFKTARGKKLCGADFKAIAMFQAESDADRRTHVQAFEAVTDRLEGKVPQSVNVKSEAITIQILDRDVQLSLLRAARRPLLEAEVVENETSGSPAGDASQEEG
jgi:hypothetical protein